MTLNTQPYKGARDFYPEDKRLEKYIFGVWREVVEKFGYEEYDAPVLEPLELYLAKSSQEIVSEQTYSFTDRGGRQVVIRPEMTPTVSRMVAARRQELAYPLRWYSIPNLWRYERPQKGRLREHWQLNVDLFGVEGLSAEFEMIQIANAIFKRFGASSDMYEIRVNSRVLLNEKIASANPKVETGEIISLIDHYEKLPAGEFQSKLAELVENPSELVDFLSNGQASSGLEILINYASSNGIDVKFVPSLARGFDYYTDIVFEVFDLNPDNNRSMMGGGRYDGLVGLFGVQVVPTVGFGLGDATMVEFLKGQDLVPKLSSETDLYVVLVGDVNAREIVRNLRENLNVAVDFTGRKLDKQIRTADKKGITWLLVIGENELKTGEYLLKNLVTGEQRAVHITDIANIIRPQT